LDTAPGDLATLVVVGKPRRSVSSYLLTALLLLIEAPILSALAFGALITGVPAAIARAARRR